MIGGRTKIKWEQIKGGTNLDIDMKRKIRIIKEKESERKENKCRGKVDNQRNAENIRRG